VDFLPLVLFVNSFLFFLRSAIVFFLSFCRN
jgi:hypothetical protein